MDVGILPVKRLDAAKKRLAPHFSENDRFRIAEALFLDALALCESVDFLDWVLVSDDETVLQTGASRGLATVTDTGEGLNAAVTLAIDFACTKGADSITVVPSDIPLAFRGDLVDLLDTGATSDVVVVPSERDGGTNGLYLSPPDLISPRFGEGSLRKHIALAEEHAYRCALLSLPRLALDIDTIEDVRDLLSKPAHGPSFTRSLLEKMPVPDEDQPVGAGDQPSGN